MARVSKGQSLIEAIVAVGMVSLLMVSLLALVSLSLKNARVAKARTTAVSLAQEGIELMRAYRDYNWNTFFSKADNNYDLPLNWVVTDALSDPCPNQPAVNQIFWRCVRLTAIDADEVTAEISVSWNEGGQELSTVQTTQLSLWER
jgi:type II secretory pathway pseudopilin PulG